MNQTFGNSLILVVFFEILLSIFLFVFTDPILKVFGVTETAYEYAYSYYRIVIIGCLFQGLSLLACDFVRVSGKPLLGMLITALGAVSNIVFDAIFVAVLDWGVVGAAWATVLGQLLSACFGLLIIISGKTKVHLHKETFLLNLGLCKKIIGCGSAFWIAQMAMGLISLVYNSQLGKYGGDIAISVYAVVSSIMTFVIMPASGISQGIQPIVGNNYGAGNYERVMSTLYQGSLLSVGITCVIWIIVLLFPEQILNAFGAEEEMLALGIIGLRINFCITPILGFVLVVTTFFQALAKAIPSIVITFLRQILFLIPFIFILPKFLGTNGIFVAQPISDLLALIICIFLVVKVRKELYNKIEK